MKKISVIVPTYNRQNYIKSSIQSVLDQELPKGWSLEIIVVDDGSTDDTMSILKSMGKQIKYVKILHSGKPSVPRNVGIDLSTGKLIAFQDSDDLWIADKLKTQLSAFDNLNVVLSYGNAEIIDADGLATKKTIVTKEELPDGESFETLLKHNVISNLTVIVRKSALKEVGNFNESPDLAIGEDYELWLRISSRYPKGIKHVNKNLAYYRRHKKNISNANSMSAVKHILNVYNTTWNINWLNKQMRSSLEEQLSTTHSNYGGLLNESEGKPAVSVVMGVYNAEKFLRPAVDSILYQTLRNFEFIIINDGSNDDTVKIINSYNDPRIRLVHQINHGLVYSLNKGFGLARADFVARMDADDISLPSRLEKQVQCMTSNNKLGVVGTFFTYIDEAHSTLSTTITSPTKHVDIIRSLYIVNPLGHGSTMIRKSAWQESGGYRDDYGPTEDYELWRRISVHWKLLVIPEPLYWYRINPEGISAQKNLLQQKFARKIEDEQWCKPFLHKSYKAILADARYYKNLDSSFSEQIYNKYADEQFLISERLLLDNINSIAGIKNMLAAIKLNKHKRRRGLRLIARGIFHISPTMLVAGILRRLR